MFDSCVHLWDICSSRINHIGGTSILFDKKFLKEASHSRPCFKIFYDPKTLIVMHRIYQTLPSFHSRNLLGKFPQETYISLHFSQPGIILHDKELLKTNRERKLEISLSPEKACHSFASTTYRLQSVHERS